jgi:hypothetical protein
VKDLPFSVYDFFGYLAAGMVVLVGLQFLGGAPPVLGREHSAMDTIALVLAIYIVGQVVAGIAKPVLEDFLVRRLLGPPSFVLVSARRSGVMPAIFRGYFTPLPERVRKRLVARASDEGAPSSGEALFLHIRFHGELRNDPALMKRLDAFLSQYGFARNVALALTVIGLSALVEARFVHRANLPFYGTMSLLLGVGMFYRYLKFFRQYSYELFNCYAGGAHASTRALH